MVAKKLFLSFKYAFDGLTFCIKNERNFRVHIVAAVTVWLAAPYYGFSDVQMMLLALVTALVIICEMFNTAIEAAIDMTVSEYSELAKMAKDVSAGAVLISAFCAVVCGLFLFLRIDTLRVIAADIAGSVYKTAAAVLYIVICYLFVRGFDKK